MSEEDASAQMNADAEFIANARQDIPYLLDLVESLRHEVERLQQENKAMEDSIFVALGVENIKEYSPVTICGIPLQTAIEILKIAKREADGWRNPINPKELINYIDKPYFHQSLDGEASEWKILKNKDAAERPELYHYGERWLAYATEPKGEADE